MMSHRFSHVLISINYPPRTGGSGRWFAEIYPRALGNAACIVTAPAENAPASKEPNQSAADANDSAIVVRMPLEFGDWGVTNLRNLSRYLVARKRVASLLGRQPIAGVHAGRVLPEGWLVWLLTWGRRLPYLVFVHGEDVSTVKLSREHTLMTRLVLRRAKLIVANSRHTADVLKNEWPGSEPKIRVLYPGVDTKRFVPAACNSDLRNRWGWNNRSIILTVGRLQKRKGHDILIQAMPEILRQVPDALYSIVGDGEERPSLERMIDELNLRHAVQFLGEPSDEDLVQLYQQADLFVLPNRTINRDFEGFGMVLLEAQACGKPVIAGDSGGTRETMQVGQTGLIVDCTRPEPLARAIVELLLDPSRRLAMGQAGRQWVETRFDWDRLAKDASVVFAELARYSDG